MTDEKVLPVTATRRRRFRPARLAVLAGVGVLVVLAVKYFWLTLPIGSGPAGPKVGRDAFREVWTTRPVLLVGIGDSVTDGFGAAPGRSYFEMLIANPPDDDAAMLGVCLQTVLPKLESRKLALSGSTSLQHESAQIPRLDVQLREVLGLVVITTGGNDLIHSYGKAPPREGAMYGATVAQAAPWIAAFDRRLGGMLDRIDASFPGGCHVFLANIYDPTDGVGDADRAGLPVWPDGMAILQAYNEIIARQAAARPNVHLVNIHDAFLGHGIHCTQPWQRYYRRADPHYWYYENLEDRNHRGYDALRRLFLIEIGRIAGTLEEAPASGPVQQATEGLHLCLSLLRRFLSNLAETEKTKGSF